MWIGWGNFSEWGGGVLVCLLLSAGISLSLSDNLIWKGTDDFSLKSNNLSLLLKCSWRYPKNLSAYLSWWSFCNNKVGAVSYYSLLLHFVNNLVASPLELLSPIILSCTVDRVTFILTGSSIIQWTFHSTPCSSLLSKENLCPHPTLPFTGDSVLLQMCITRNEKRRKWEKITSSAPLKVSTDC